MVISIFITVATFLVLLAILSGLRHFKYQKQPPSGGARESVRSPGQSLLAKSNSLSTLINLYCIYAFNAPLIFYAVHISRSYFGGVPETLVRTMTSTGFALALLSYSIYQLIKLHRERTRLRLGYEGSLAVGQELDRLRHDGFYIYHDFPADTFTIDHVVVGSKGVFAIQTRTISTSAAKKRVEDATVEYDGRMLYYPKSGDSETVEHARQQALWLSHWLGETTGEPIAARAIVALPGWLIKRTSSEGISVVNPKQFASLFEHIKPRTLPESMLTRIIQQIEQKCSGKKPAPIESQIGSH